MNIKQLSILIFILSFLVVSCAENKSGEKDGNSEETEAKEAGKSQDLVKLTQEQFEALDIKKDTLARKTMSGYIEVNGELEVPPQSEAHVTTVFGANVTKILVIEGENVRKGQVLAYISHPDIVQIQTDFLNSSNDLDLKEKEFNRQKKLYDAGVGSGELFQSAEAALKSAKGRYSGFKSQIEILNLNPAVILEGNIQRAVPLLSPIEGAVQKINVKTGQFVEAQTSLFEIVNTHHVHADLMIFEKDVSKVEVGQEVVFTVESLPGVSLKANILSISQTFEKDPKALHAHAEIKNKPENLIPGMYVRGRIVVDDQKMIALPEEAVVRNNGRDYMFTVNKTGETWEFVPVEVRKGAEDAGWIEITPMAEIPKDTEVAYNSAYYLMAEMQKSEAGHGH